MKITAKSWVVAGIVAGWILVIAFVLFPREMWGAYDDLGERWERADPINEGAHNLWQFTKDYYGMIFDW